MCSRRTWRRCKRLTHPVRDPRAGYEQTLAVLAHAKQYKPAVLTKTSLMLGLGETDEEIAATMDDLRAANVDLLTLGQYLRPTMHHLPVVRFVTPAEFDKYRQWALAKGFRECVSGPLVRSSYRAEQALAGNNAGLVNGDTMRQRRFAGRCRPQPLSNPDCPRRASVRWLGGSSTNPPGGRCSASPTRATRAHARRDLAARASAGVHAGTERRSRPTCSPPATSRW